MEKGSLSSTITTVALAALAAVGRWRCPHFHRSVSITSRSDPDHSSDAASRIRRLNPARLTDCDGSDRALAMTAHFRVATSEKRCR